MKMMFIRMERQQPMILEAILAILIQRVSLSKKTWTQSGPWGMNDVRWGLPRSCSSRTPVPTPPQEASTGSVAPAASTTDP